MSPPLLAVALGLGLGFSLAAPPGPMNALIARTAAHRGPGPAIRVGLGAPVADVIFLVALVFGVGRILDTPGFLRGAAAGGALLMAYFAWGAWQDRAKTHDDATPPRLGNPTFPSALLAALSNPYQIGWWLTGGFAFLQAQGWWGIGGFLVGIFAWVALFAFLVARGAQRWPRLRTWISIASAIMLAFFALLLAAIATGLA